MVSLPHRHIEEPPLLADRVLSTIHTGFSWPTQVLEVKSRVAISGVIRVCISCLAISLSWMCLRGIHAASLRTVRISSGFFQKDFSFCLQAYDWFEFTLYEVCSRVEGFLLCRTYNQLHQQAPLGRLSFLHLSESQYCIVCEIFSWLLIDVWGSSLLWIVSM